MIKLTQPALTWPDWLSLANVLNTDRDKLHPPESGIPDPPRLPDIDYLLSWLQLSEKEQEARWQTLFSDSVVRLEQEQTNLSAIADEQLIARSTQIDDEKKRVTTFQEAVVSELATPIVA